MAISLVHEHKGRICLLITDEVIPGKEGRDLTDRLISSHPELRHLFMSG